MIFRLDKENKIVRVEFADEADMLAEAEARLGVRVGELLIQEGMTGKVFVSVECAGQPIAIFAMTRDQDKLERLWTCADELEPPDLVIRRPRHDHSGDQT